jgi:hypothetical protein
MRIAATVIALMLMLTTSAQYKFHSQNYFGALAGDFDAALSFSTINGLQRGPWFGGIGTGVDNYYIRTVPLYLSLTRFLTNKFRSAYFTLDGGTNFVWDNSTANVYNYYSNDGDFSPLLYYGAHAGFKLGINKKSGSVLMSVGYSAKKINERYNTTFPCLVPPCPEYDQKFEYDFKRFSFRLGWMF